ncbi:E3 ubiquitin-protein ligase TRIM33-like [Dreissena polymorpha]|uniref:Uncharacterized protein n=1 Tax=Dreissena polymorpha TaxID=45954 RepID=A0A9D4F4C1_DREPO|nr:E3 ubiquitin-protein ligase TRIM33-like [Dreissena polymorpha]KAH3790723.1 hypothetical protein DPMN_168930 [Dreissena polymorpha]
MATNKESIAENDSKCSICKFIFWYPRILPCKHSFCHVCLCGVIKRNEGSSAFLCPLCQASTNTDAPISTESTEILVTKFRVNVALQSPLERRCVCRVCKTDIKDVIATLYCMNCCEHMCSVCGEIHTKYKQMANHLLCRSKDAPPPNVRNLLQELRFCPSHGTENLEYICYDHDQPCCNKCAITSHRKCEKVMLISDVIKSDKSYEASVKEWKEMIDNALKRVSALCSHLKKEPSRISNRHENIKTQLNEIKSAVNQELESLRKTVERAFTEEKSKILTSTDESLRDATAKMTDIQHKKEELECVLSNGDDVQKYLYMRNQPKCVDADAAWQTVFTQKRIILHNRSCLSRCKDKQTLLDCVLADIKSLVEVKQEICK